MTFWYHMKGQHVNALYLVHKQGSLRTDLFTKRYDQGKCIEIHFSISSVGQRHSEFEDGHIHQYPFLYAWKFTPVSCRTPALLGRCPTPTSSADHFKQGIGYRWPCAILSNLNPPCLLKCALSTVRRRKKFPVLSFKCFSGFINDENNLSLFIELFIKRFFYFLHFGFNPKFPVFFLFRRNIDLK